MFLQEFVYGSQRMQHLMIPASCSTLQRLCLISCYGTGEAAPSRMNAASKSHLACIYAALQPWNSWRSALSIVPRRSPAAMVALAAGCSTSSWLNTCLLLRLLKPPARRPYLLLSPMPGKAISGPPQALCLSTGPQYCSFLRKKEWQDPLGTLAGYQGAQIARSRP